MPKKFKSTPCPITRSQFRRDAQGLKVTITDQAGNVVARGDLDVKEFSTLSLGWYYNGKIDVKVGNTVVKAQGGFNLTIANSKELPVDDAPPALAS
jgi:hypothetical protein